MQHTRNWDMLKTLLKLCITVGALYWVMTNIDVDEFQQTIKKSNPLFLFLALLSYGCSQLIASSRLNSFFKSIGLQLTERYNLRLYQLGLLYNFFLPGGIGGDGYKIFFLKKRFHTSRRKVLGAVFFDRLSGLWALGMVIGALIIFMPRLAIPNPITLAVMLVATLSYLYILRLFFKPFLKNFIVTHFKALCVQGFQTLAAICILYALGFNGKFAPYLLIFMVTSLAAIIPSVGGGLGIRDLAMIHLAEYLQLDQHLALSITLTFYIISLVVASTGVYYVFRPQRLGTDKLPSAKEVEHDIQTDQ